MSLCLNINIIEVKIMKYVINVIVKEKLCNEINKIIINLYINDNLKLRLFI